MKINYLWIGLLSTLFITSCSNEETTIAGAYTGDPTFTVILSDDSLGIEKEIEKTSQNYPKKFIFANPHSELWNNGSLLKVSPAVAIGYDAKENLNSSFQGAFGSSATSWDSRIIPYPRAIYIIDKYLYKKNIQIPTGATLSIPPEDVMSDYTPMGWIPGTSKTGYKYTLVGSSNGYDTYQLITEVWQTNYNISGQQVAPADNPIFWKLNFYTPNNFNFKYIYTEVEW